MQKVCAKHGMTEWSEGNRNRCRRCLVEAVQRRRKKVKLMAVEYKGGKCQRCGYNKCVDAMDFHHRDPNEKDFSVSHKGHCKSWQHIKKELDKCDLLCSNCHREIHSQGDVAEGF